MDTILQFDHTVIFYIQQHFISSYLTPIMYWLSKITSAGALWILISIILMIQKEISRYWPWNVHFLSLSIHHR